MATLNKSSSDNITLLSATPFEVLEHTSEIDVPQEVERSSDSASDIINGTFTIAGSSRANYTYLAVLIRKDAYSLDVRLESNGTKDLTNLSINGAQIIKSWKIGGVGWENITGITVQDWVTEAFEPNSASIDLGKGKKGNSFGFSLPIDEDYDEGNYYLNVGAWNLSDPSQDLVAFNQDVINVNTVSPTDQKVIRRSGGGGGGGGGISTPPPLLAESAALYTSFHTFNDDTESTIEIPSNYASETGVSRLRGKTTAVTTVSFAVSRVSDLPSNVPQPDSEVYRIFEVVFTEFSTASEVEPSGSIEFKVTKEWINEKEYDAEDIMLLKYKEGWQELETELIDEDETYYYYEADMGSFSIFAITAPIGTSISPPTTQPTTPSPTQPEPNMTVTVQPSTTPEATPEDTAFSFFNNPAIMLIIINAVVIGLVALIIYLKRI